jgi:ATP-dependent DNA ligase
VKQRRRVLEGLVWHHSTIFPARRPADDGLKAWQEAMARGYEGIVAKDPESRYVPRRTLKWLKVKQKDYLVEQRGFYDPGRR